MEEYNPLGDSSAPRGNFLYSSSPPVLATHSSSPGGNFVIRSSSTNGGSIFGNHQMAIGINNNTCNVSGETSGQGYEFVKSETGGGSQSQHVHDFQYHLLREYQISSGQRQKGNDVVDVDVDVDAMKAKIVSHSQFSNLLQAFLDCQKVGAPPDVEAQLASACNGFEERRRSSMASGGGSKDQELDQFMEAYYGVLVKYREELTRPIQEAADFMQRIESQLITLCNGSLQILPSDDKCEGIGSSEEDQDNSGGGGSEKELTADQIDPRAEERELKSHLLKKYSGYLSSLKQELSKKKKKGKLPKDARQELLRWWELHNKWPYPSEAEKLALAESTGLDQKQINNWFINQRKRHWKPSEDMQFMAMDGFYHPNAAFYIDGHYMGDAHYRLGP